MGITDMKIEIKSWINGKVLFTLECASWRVALEAAVKQGAYLQGAYLQGEYLQGADLQGADLQGAYLKGAYLQGAYLKGAYLQGAYLQGADLQGADLKGADLQGAYLKGAYLKGADLQGAYLKGAYLQGAYLQGAYLKGADLKGADLKGAYLKGAYLKGADLQGAYLQGAYLKGAKGFSPEHSTPLLMLLDQPGPIRAYKLVGANGEGFFNGGIKYEIGKSYEVKDALTDTNVPCGVGINLATLDWCLKELEIGCRVLVAEFTAKDIAAIPTATDGKFRVYRCKIVGEKKLKKAWFPKERR